MNIMKGGREKQIQGPDIEVVINNDVDSPLKDDDDPKNLISPTGTEWSNGSSEGPFDENDSQNGNRVERYGKIAAIFALLLLLSVAATLITMFIRNDNENRNKNQLDVLNENDGGGGRDRPGLIGKRQPTPKPTGSPTVSPSENPSTSPSDTPSLRPSAIPSAMPSSQPSASPSGLPSISPTEYPTTSPSESPTSRPTRDRIPEDFRFRLKMYWERRYYWQEEWDERRWCAECTTCRELTTSGFGEGCWDRDGRDRHDCDDDDQLWLMRCDGFDGGSGNAQFELVRHDFPHEADQIKIRGRNLCLERATNRHLNLQRCRVPDLDDPDSIRQLFVGIRLDGDPFVIKPYQQNWRPNQYDDPVEVELCVSQHHHPKAGEVLYLEECELAANWDTILWEFY